MFGRYTNRMWMWNEAKETQGGTGSNTFQELK